MRNAESDEAFDVVSFDRSWDSDDGDDPRIVVDIVAPPLMAPAPENEGASPPLPDALAGWYYTG